MHCSDKYAVYFLCILHFYIVFGTLQTELNVLNFVMLKQRISVIDRCLMASIRFTIQLLTKNWINDLGEKISEYLDYCGKISNLVVKIFIEMKYSRKNQNWFGRQHINRYVLSTISIILRRSLQCKQVKLFYLHAVLMHTLYKFKHISFSYK